MSFTSMMVHQNVDAHNDSRLQIAANLAQRFGAKLIGIAACEVNPPAYASGAFASAIFNELRLQTESKLKEAAVRFGASAEGNVREIEWRQAFAKPTAYVAQEGRAADVIITGAARDSAYIDPFTQLDPGDLIMQAGRPVLMVPPEAESLEAKHVLVAWKDTREARRAVLDALPFLQAATDVTVVEVGSRAEIEYAARRGEDVAGWLKRHGVCAAANAIVASEQPFEALEALLLQNAADLVVAGAYGHSRVQEWIFGGVTRDLLTKARCCCLFALAALGCGMRSTPGSTRPFCKCRIAMWTRGGVNARARAGRQVGACAHFDPRQFCRSAFP